MFTFEKRDDGYMVFDSDGRGVASVLAFKLEPSVDHKTKEVTEIFKAIERGNWEIHFTGNRLTPVEIETFLKELAEQK